MKISVIGLGFVGFPLYISILNISQRISSVVGLEEKVQSSMTVFPVPSDDVVYVQVNGTEITSYEVVDMMGRSIASKEGVSLSVVELNGKELGAGTYIIKVETSFGNAQKKIIIR